MGYPYETRYQDFHGTFNACLDHIINIKYFGNLLSYSVGLKIFPYPKKSTEKRWLPRYKTHFE